jgi:putative restriction endonuclease
VRSISDSEYDLIFRSAFSEILVPVLVTPSSAQLELADEPETFERPIAERVVARPFRDAAFSVAVKKAYDNTCAFTGLRIINGGGLSEVQAAHIRPVSDSGPDSVRSGLALCGTVHWMFDRGLFSIDDDFTILTAKDRVPDTILRMTNPDGKLHVPARPESRPHRQFLKFHRDWKFKG